MELPQSFTGLNRARYDVLQRSALIDAANVNAVAAYVLEDSKKCTCEKKTRRWEPLGLTPQDDGFNAYSSKKI
jgi:hypothetical protein